MHAIRLQSKGAKPEYARNVKEVCMSGRQFVGLSICPSVCANMYIYVPVYVKVGKSIFIICMYAICSYVCVYMYTYILLHIYIYTYTCSHAWQHSTVPYRFHTATFTATLGFRACLAGQAAFRTSPRKLNNSNCRAVPTLCADDG